MVKALVRILISLKLTIVCLIAALLLVFVGTIAQVNQGLYAAQNRYFRSFLVWWGPPGADWSVPVFPGGYLVGTVLLVNLLASHYTRFGFGRKKLGITLTHAGLILLLVGQLATDLLSVESTMRLTEGETKNYSESQRSTELVVVDASSSSDNLVFAFPEAGLRPGRKLQNAEWPFSVVVRDYFPNCTLSNLAQPSAAKGAASTQGAGVRLALQSLPPTVRSDHRNIPGAVVEIIKSDGASQGTWLVSPWIERLQDVEVGGRTFQLGMRVERQYRPIALTLLKFSHDKYKGTEIPKNFSSRVRIQRADTREDREVLIYMNNPLRYGGETFYQSGYDENDPRVTILQVVKNPGWLTPYIACVMVGLGLAVQFLGHWLAFLRKKAA